MIRTGWPKRAGIAVAAALATAALAACGGAAPSASPSLSSDQTASVFPDASLTETGETWGDAAGLASPGEVTVGDRVPDALPVPAGLLENTTRGWVLVTYSPMYPVNESGSRVSASDVQILYLVSPEGERYQVLELDPNSPMELLDWTAGDTRVIVRDAYSRVETSTGVYEPIDTWYSLDLESGSVEPYAPAVPVDAIRAGTTASGLRLWWTWYDEPIYVTDADGGLVNTIMPDGRLTLREDDKVTGSVDPGGNRLAWTVGRDLTVVGLRDGAETTVEMSVPAADTCEFSAWLDDARALVFCMDMGGSDSFAVTYDESDLNDLGATFYRVDVSTGVAIEMGGPTDGSHYFKGFLVGATPVGQIEEACPSGAPYDDRGAYLFAGTTLEPVAELQGFTSCQGMFGDIESTYIYRDEVLDDVLYGRFLCSTQGDVYSEPLIRWDSSSREVTVLIPGQDVQLEPVVTRDIVSVVVAQ